MPKLIYLYRGVHAEHPALADAREGIVRAAKEGNSVGAEEHNWGLSSAASPFTSWTLSRERAVWFARRRGSGGILLRVLQGAPKAGDTWAWQWSPDLWMEDEVLMRGVRLQVEAFEV